MSFSPDFLQLHYLQSYTAPMAVVCGIVLSAYSLSESDTQTLIQNGTNPFTAQRDTTNFHRVYPLVPPFQKRWGVHVPPVPPCSAAHTKGAQGGVRAVARPLTPALKIHFSAECSRANSYFQACIRVCCCSQPTVLKATKTNIPNCQSFYYNKKLSYR